VDSVSGDPAIGSAPILAPESLVRVTVNDEIALSWCCTPHDLEELASGWLVCEGAVRNREEIEELAPASPEAGCSAALTVRLAPEALDRLRESVSGSTGLTMGPTTLGEPHGAQASKRETRVMELQAMLRDRDRVAAWFVDMFDRASIRSSVGGVHTGGLVANGVLTGVVEDVSRHHVVDRLAGLGLREDVDLARSIFLLSSRISGAMAAKASRAGVGALVSRSVPTELAASVAGVNDLILVGRARRERPQYHWPRAGGSE
jgi:FdhD protein